jgi:signal transduction histidine kinase
VVLAAEAESRFLGDEVRVGQILGNLIDNAAKFTEAGEIAITVAWDRDGGDLLRFEVRDTGIGFDAQTKVRLFSRFQQADGSITRRFGGSGLGLAISRGLAEQMGGTLEADSEPGAGSTFVLRLPLRLAPCAQAAWSEPSKGAA